MYRYAGNYAPLYGRMGAQSTCPHAAHKGRTSTSAMCWGSKQERCKGLYGLTPRSYYYWGFELFVMYVPSPLSPPPPTHTLIPCLYIPVLLWFWAELILVQNILMNVSKSTEHSFAGLEALIINRYSIYNKQFLYTMLTLARSIKRDHLYTAFCSSCSACESSWICCTQINKADSIVTTVIIITSLDGRTMAGSSSSILTGESGILLWFLNRICVGKGIKISGWYTHNVIIITQGLVKT